MQAQQHQHPFERDLVLVGGGHTHALVLLRWAMKPLPGVRLTLISEHSTSPYSGMLPGLVAGHYQPDDVYVDLRRLCAQAGARFICARVDGVDAVARQVLLADRPPIDYDLLSINAGITPDLSVPGAAEYAVPVKPIVGFWSRWVAERDELLRAREAKRIAVVGGGAGSVELALSMAYRLQNAPVMHRVSLVTRGDDVLSEYPRRMRRWLYRRLRYHGIAVHPGFDVSRVSATGIEDDRGRTLELDRVFWCTQARAAPWFAGSGLPTTEQGFIRVLPSLQCVDHPQIFAAGDCAWIDGMSLPRAGVYAVREAPLLYRNLRSALQGKPLKPFRPQRHFLSLLACGGNDAVGARGPLSLAGPWVWRWKDRIDRRFMRMFHELPVQPPPRADADHSLEPPAARCGGCGAKVGADVLLQALSSPSSSAADKSATCTINVPDDAAVIPLHTSADNGGSALALVQSIDALKPLFDDPYLFARVTAQHALSDLFAMHAQPHSAQLLVQLPIMKETLQVRDMRQMLAGVRDVLEPLNAQIVGGHTLEGDGLQLGLTVNGFAAQGQLLRKAGARDGDVLIVTKPLGTGAIFAAAMRGAAKAEWVDAAIDSMQQGNAEAAAIFAAHGAHALTDVTGFGLLGHLLEMLGPMQLGATVQLDQLPAIDGALACIDKGYQSTLAPANRRARHRVSLDGVSAEDSRYLLLYDPQTSGGLLGAVPTANAQQCVAALSAAGIAAVAVGKCGGDRLRVVSQ